MSCVTRTTRTLCRLLLSVVALLAVPAAQAAVASGPLELVAALELVHGKHPGARKDHARGICAAGEFTPAAAGKALSVSPLFAGEPVAALARFSVAGGDPESSEVARTPRGLALQFSLPYGRKLHMSMLSTPVFAAKDPGSYMGLLLAQLPDPVNGKVDAKRLADYRTANPDTKAQPAWLAANAPPWSYATSAYHGIHAFFFVDAAGKQQPVRWKFVPRDGVRGLTAKEMAEAPPAFLTERLVERLAKGPVLFDMVVSLGQPGDTLVDPTVAWPAARRQVTVGTLAITASGGDGCERVSFNPNELSDGIVASEDPVLRMRTATNAVSVGRRVNGR